MAEWWESLSIELRVFYTIGIISTLVLIVQTLLMLIGIGHDGHVDGDVGDMSVDVHTDGLSEHPSGLHFLSIRTIIAFFTGFGWTGVICLKDDMSMMETLGTSLFVGGAFMAGVIYLMKMLYGLRDSGNIHYRNALGKIATVYAPIPASQAGPGQIEILLQGRVRFIQAFTKANHRLASNIRVKVIDMIDAGTVLVEPLETPAAQEKEE